MSTTGPDPIHTMIASGQGYYGPFRNGGNLFCVLRDASFSVWSKPVSGSTWTMEAAPPTGGIGENPGDTYFDGQKIWYLATTGGGSTQQLLNFDCTTRAWATVGGPGGANLWILQPMVIAALPSGDALVFGTDAIPRNIGFYKVSAGGTWSSFTILHTEVLTVGSIAQSGIAGIAVDQVSGTAHAVYCDGVSGSGIVLYYRKILASGGLSAEQTISTFAQGSLGVLAAGDHSGMTTVIFGNQLFLAQIRENSFPFPSSSSAWVSSALDDTTSNPASWTLITGYEIPGDTDSQAMIGTHFGWTHDTRLRLLVDFGIPNTSCDDANNNNYYIETDAPNTTFNLYAHGYKFDEDANIVWDQLVASRWNGTGFDAGVPVVDFLATSPPGACVGGQGWSGGNDAVFASVEYTLVDSSPVGPGVTCGSPPSGKVGVAYSHTFPASDGTPPYAFTITTGTLPPGLLLTSGTGSISGTPTLAGDYPVTVTVTDAASATGTANCSLHIDPGTLINCNAPPSGALGNPYSHSLTITGAPAGSTVAITGGALPPGLTIDDTGLISGTPTLGGSYTYTATVTPPGLRSARSVSDLPASGLGWDFRQCENAPIPGAIGGYEHSGNQYLFLYQGSEFGVGDSKIHALKSTDLGVTWTDTGSISVPSTAGVTAITNIVYTTCMDGSTVYLMAVDIDGTGLTTADAQCGPLLLYKYDLTTNSFDSGGPASGAPAIWKMWDGTTYPPRSSVCLHLLRRGAGDMVLLYTGVETIGGNKWARIYAGTFNGSSCGAGVALAGQAGTADAFIEKCATFDASHNLHVILSGWSNHDVLYHVGMDPGGGFGTFQTVESDAWQNDTSNLLDFAAPADTLAFLVALDHSSTNDNGNLVIYSAPGGTLSPTWTFHNLPSTANAVVDPQIAPDWLAALAYLNGTLYAYWTQTGVPHTWHLSSGMGEIRGSTAAASDLTTWTAEASIMGPFDSGTTHWGASQVTVWSGPGIGLGVLGNFEGYDTGGTNQPIEMSKLLVIPPAGGGGGPASVTCTTTVGYGHLSTSCGAPPVYTQGVAGAPYRPPVVMGEIGLPPVYDLNHTLVWTFPAVVPPGMHWETDPASPNYGYLVGAPTSSGVQSFTYQVFAPDGQSVTNTCPLTVNPSGGGGGGGGGGGPLHIFCNNPPGGKVGVPYSHTFPVVGATGSTVYSVVVGALPPGVTLDPATGDLTGTPTAPGTYSFSVKVQQ